MGETAASLPGTDVICRQEERKDRAQAKRSRIVCLLGRNFHLLHWLELGLRPMGSSKESGKVFWGFICLIVTFLSEYLVSKSDAIVNMFFQEVRSP